MDSGVERLTAGGAIRLRAAHREIRVRAQASEPVRERFAGWARRTSRRGGGPGPRYVPGLLNVSDTRRPSVTSQIKENCAIRFAPLAHQEQRRPNFRRKT